MLANELIQRQRQKPMFLPKFSIGGEIGNNVGAMNQAEVGAEWGLRTNAVRTGDVPFVNQPSGIVVRDVMNNQPQSPVDRYLQKRSETQGGKRDQLFDMLRYALLFRALFG